jgi:trans-aconitate methyltransferase
MAHELPADIDVSIAHSARAYDWYLGGKDNFAKDRELGQRTEAVWPTVRVFARENRRFMQRAVRYLAAEEGIGQFLDIGTGIPTSPNVHEIAQEARPASHVVYVDHDPLVISHARARLSSAQQGLTKYVHADAREPETILEQAVDILDLSRPVALLIIAVLHFVPDDWDAQGILARFLAGLAPGSFLVATQITDEHDPGTIRAAAGLYTRAAGRPAQARTADAFEELAFISQGLRQVDPGVVPVSDWRNPAPHRPSAAEVSCYGGAGQKI